MVEKEKNKVEELVSQEEQKERMFAYFSRFFLRLLASILCRFGGWNFSEFKKMKEACLSGGRWRKNAATLCGKILCTTKHSCWLHLRLLLRFFFVSFKLPSMCLSNLLIFFFTQHWRWGTLVIIQKYFPFVFLNLSLEIH